LPDLFRVSIATVPCFVRFVFFLDRSLFRIGPKRLCSVRARNVGVLPVFTRFELRPGFLGTRHSFLPRFPKMTPHLCELTSPRVRHVLIHPLPPSLSLRPSSSYCHRRRAKGRQGGFVGKTSTPPVIYVRPHLLVDGGIPLPLSQLDT